MEKHRSAVPTYAIVCLTVMAASQLFLFYIPRLFLPYLTLHVLTGPLDERIPFSPPWVTVYFLSFPYWLGTLLWVCCKGKDTAYRTAAAYVLALVISAAIFLIWPGTMELDAFSVPRGFSHQSLSVPSCAAYVLLLAAHAGCRENSALVPGFQLRIYHTGLLYCAAD